MTFLRFIFKGFYDLLRSRLLFEHALAGDTILEQFD